MVRVPVKPAKVSVPKSMSCSFDSVTGLMTLTEVTAVMLAAWAGAAAATVAARARDRTDKRRIELTFE